MRRAREACELLSRAIPFSIVVPCGAADQGLKRKLTCWVFLRTSACEKSMARRGSQYEVRLKRQIGELQSACVNGDLTNIQMSVHPSSLRNNG